MARHNETGKAGEAEAVRYLESIGHQILERNYRFGRAEIDIISLHRGLLIFTEVKTRKNNRYGYPEEFVDNRKIRLIKQAAEEYVYRTGWQGELRFDIIAFTVSHKGKALRHIPDAFFYEAE
ncbi:MAG: YraN family protein [Chitinophagales bacterium]|nr:YraN family protein [Chitinophagales bacterium]MDW8419011.1 YraN family protein [Chitinophagales bacterium]